MAAKKGRLEICELLLTYDGDFKNPKPNCLVNAADVHGKTALHAAAQGNHSVIIDLLVKHGARVNWNFFKRGLFSSFNFQAYSELIIYQFF